MSSDKQIAIDHLVTYRKSLKNKPFLIDMFIPSKKTIITDYDLTVVSEADNQYTIVVTDKKFYNFVAGRLFSLKDHENVNYFTVTEVIDIDKYNISTTNFKVTDKYEAYLSFYDEFEIQHKHIDNFSEKRSAEITTVGRFFIEHFLLADVFGDIFPYDNTQFNFGKYEKEICIKTITKLIDVAQVYSYIDRLTFMESLVSIFMPSLTKELLVLNPQVKQLINDLLRKHQHELHDPKVMIMIEDEIIKADKESLKDNPAMDYASNKTFDVHRKRMFHGFGAMEAFGDVDSTINFLKSNLDEGWNKDELNKLFNDVRKGSYSRGIETAKGGSTTKTITRTFQSSVIVEDDCKTKEGISIILNTSNIEDYLFRYIIDPKDQSKVVLLDEATIPQYLGKTVTLRDPMFCKTSETGYCFTCFGYKYKQLNVTRLVSEPPKIGSTMMGIAMKSMHGTKAELHEIHIDDFIS